ncbi:MAG: hypothetical protein KDD66_02525 [Bdellovibrionales bacterium]|nr:hypothetical protein [Bdellovibrionales bacterium]
MTLNQINYLNIVLMFISCAFAFYMPYEAFLFSYAVLGPLHYLTEISWLHDRNYFTSGKYDYLFLIVPAFPVALGLDYQLLPGVFSNTLLVWIAFASALGMVLFKRPLQKILLGVAVFFCGMVLSGVPGFSMIISLMLPTIIHVYVFTGLFILYGALKSDSFSGYLSFAVFLFCGLIFFIFTPPAEHYILGSYVKNAIEPFKPVQAELVRMFGLEGSWDVLVAVMRFIAFAYTYHYLNWFSKTKVIGWHEISRDRLILIVTGWIFAVTLYAFNYTVGLVALLLLSFLHVLLEFPLNHVSIVGIGRELNKRFASSANS